MAIEDPMLPTLMTGQPAQGVGFGQPQKPSPKPPQQSGFMNQTNDKQWWGGQSGSPAPADATSGYGTSTPIPAPTTPPPGGGAGGGTGGGTPGGGTGTPTAPTHAQKVKKQNMINMLRMAQATVLQRQQELQSWMKTGDQHRINNAQQQLMKAQWEVQDWQKKISELGF